MPKEYPQMSHYIKNEMTTSDVISGLTKFKEHNPDAFHIFYGGEPILRKDLATIINFCNRESIHYTIISNNTEEIQPLIKKLTEDVNDKIKGFTASIDPVFFDENESEDSIRKSLQGFSNLKDIQDDVEDVVAEITVMNHNYKHIYRLVSMLTEVGINSDITFIDIAKSPYYDFSNISDTNLLVRQTAQLADQFQKLNDDKLLSIHMKHVLIPAIWGMLPSNMDCKIEEKLHNISVDADGSIRLCLRIRGITTPGFITLRNLIKSDGSISLIAHEAIKQDKEMYCRLCNHTCHIMSKYINDNDLGPDDLVHLDRRK
jgi:MoaA/NifB/PqqE/SkfB family radical SAM enzyme